MNSRIKRGTALLLLALTACLCGCGKEPDNSGLLVATIKDEGIYLDEAMYYIWQMEKECKTYEEMFRQQGEEDFWDMDAGEGMKVRDEIKEDVLRSIVKNHILYRQALSEGYALAQDEEKEGKEKAKLAMAELAGGMDKITGLTAGVLTRIFEEQAVVGRYIKDKVESFGLDREELAADIRREDYVQYDVETISLPKNTQDAYQKLEECLAAAREADTLETLAQDDMSAFVFEEFGFIPGQGSCDPDTEEEAVLLQNGETSDVIETKDSYLIIRMVNNHSAEGYEDAVKSAAANGENAAFDKYYQTIKASYTVLVNHEVWDKIRMGETTQNNKKTEDKE